jgi:uncharacterized protein YjbJ (UPF0337 family)
MSARARDSFSGPHRGGREYKRERTTNEDPMNKEQAAGKWNQIKGRAKKAWAELTDDDFERAEGSVDKLHGIIQEKVGDTKEKIKEKLDALLD